MHGIVSRIISVTCQRVEKELLSPFIEQEWKAQKEKVELSFQVSISEGKDGAGLFVDMYGRG